MDSDKPDTEKPANSKIEAADAQSQRRSRWRSGLDALSYISRLSRQSELKIRETDHATGLAVLLAALATILCFVLHKWTGLSLQLTLSCDLFLGISLIIYIFNRLGILTGMNPRQALLTWQLIRAVCFVGVFITINIALVISLTLSWLPLSSLSRH